MLQSQMRSSSMLQHRQQRGALHQVRPVPLPSITAPRPIVRTSASAGSSGSDEASRKKEAQVWIAAWRERTLGAKPSSGVTAASATPAPVPAPVPAAAETNDVAEYAKLAIGIASLYFLDQAIKTAFLSVGFKFPSALGGMFGVVVLLGALGEDLAAKLSKFYAPALDWIAKWLPLFYVASLVTLPLNLKGIPFDQLTKILIILAVGMVGTLLFTAQTTVFIRELVQTPNKEVAKAKPATPFLPSHFLAWGAIAAASLGLCAFNPAQFGAQCAVPFNLAATLLGYLAGNAVPKAYHGILHPVVVTAVTANVSALAYGNLMGLTYDAAQKLYYSKGVGAWGAGDVLMAFLGPVIVSFGFRIYAQRNTMQRHAPEILGATFLSSLFSFFSTAFAAKALGLSSELARALIPRSVTVALALPIATQLEAPLAITAAAVLLQGLLGANFGPGLMSAVGIKDTIARGLAAAGTAGGLGTASLTSKEPEALPFCALSYSMVGILSTLLASTPFVRAALISIVG